MVVRRTTKERLQKAISAFKLEDFHKYVVQEFKHVLPEETFLTEVDQNHLRVSKKELISLYLNLLVSIDFNNEDCERSIALLQIQAVALRAESRHWTALRLEGEPDAYGYSDTHVESLVSRSLRRNGFETITRAVHYSSAFWINITIKKVTRQRGIVLQSPIYCVFYLDHPLIFISKSISANIEQGLIEAFGYVGYSACKLTGRDPRSMLEILTTRDARLETVRSVNIDSEPRETTHGLDFSQFQKRRRYMDELFHSDPPKLSDYSVECKESPWHAHSAFPEMADEAYFLTLHLRTRDTIGVFRALAEEGLLDLPVPTYVSRALKCARNKVRVRANRDMDLNQTAASYL